LKVRREKVEGSAINSKKGRKGSELLSLKNPFLSLKTYKDKLRMASNGTPLLLYIKEIEGEEATHPVRHWQS